MSMPLYLVVIIMVVYLAFSVVISIYLSLLLKKAIVKGGIIASQQIDHKTIQKPKGICYPKYIKSIFHFFIVQIRSQKGLPKSNCVCNFIKGKKYPLSKDCDYLVSKKVIDSRPQSLPHIANSNIGGNGDSTKRELNHNFA